MSVLAALLLAAAPMAAPAPQAAPIAFTLKSWGKTLLRWRMDADGTITLVRAVDRPGGDFRHYREITRVTPSAPSRRQWVVQELKPVLAAVAEPPACGQRITDLPYGEIVWGEGNGARRLTYDVGCTGTAAARLNARLRRVSDQIELWAAKEADGASRDVEMP